VAFLLHPGPDASPPPGPGGVSKTVLDPRAAFVAGAAARRLRYDFVPTEGRVKLASVRIGSRDVVAAAAGDHDVFELESLLELLRPRPAFPPPATLLDVIQGGEALLRSVDAALAIVSADVSLGARLRCLPDAWYPPVRAPGKICAVAMNNSASNARKISAPDHPAFFLKPASCLIGHLAPIRIRRYYGSVHPEPELAVVIGRQTRDVPAARALDAVYGYSIFNDITGNGMRAEDMFHYWAVYPKKDNPNETERVEQHLSYAARYKGSDTFGVLGPWLVTRDEIANPDDLEVRCRIHGEVIAEDSTRYYNYKVAEVISFISYFHTLNPGDVISMGTAFKPAASRQSIHHANFQTVSGPVEISIDGLGTQRNPVVIEEQDLGQWRLR
jgi:2-keto-4-pentenoate hydratase/2-oxohepta-3-ene-1,7-dioic acid hydratase in catechol pathway